MNRKKIGDSLTGLLKGTRGKYAAVQERDRIEQARAGAETIRTKGFAFKELEAEARGIVEAARNEAYALLDAEIDAAGGALVEAPCADAANYAAAISARDDMTADEVQAALAKYKDHASQRAIRAAARRSGLTQYAGATDAETYLADLRDLRADVSRTFDPLSFGNLSDGMVAIKAAGYASFGDGGSSTSALDVFAALGNIVEES